MAEVRLGLQRSPLLASLADADIDRLAVATVPSRFAAGETIVDSRTSSRSIAVVVEGRALLVLVEPDEPDATVAELGEGDLLGLTDDIAGGRVLVVRAVTDCEVLSIEAEAAAEIGGRNADVADALDRTSSIRRRRVDRIIERRSPADGATRTGDDA